MGTGINVDSGIEKKSDKDIGIIIESKSDEVQDHIQVQVQFRKKDNLLKCQGGSQNFGQIQKDVRKLNLDFRPQKECEWVKWLIQVQKLLDAKLAQECYLVQVILQELIMIQGLDLNC